MSVHVSLFTVLVTAFSCSLGTLSVVLWLGITRAGREGLERRSLICSRALLGHAETVRVVGH